MSLMCPLIITGSYHQDITRYATAISIITGTDGIGTATGTDMTGISVITGNMRGAVMEKIFITAGQSNRSSTIREI